MNDPTNLPFDRIPLSGGTATMNGPRVGASLDDLLSGSALLPPTRSPVSVTPPVAGPKVTVEPTKPAEPAKVETPAPPPEPRWVKEALRDLLMPSRRKVAILSSAAALAAGALAVNALFSGQVGTTPTTPSTEPSLASTAPAPPPVSVSPPTPETTQPFTTGSGLSVLPIPVLPSVDVPIATPAPPGGYQITPSVLPNVPPASTSGTYGGSTYSGVPVVPPVGVPSVIPAGASEPVPATSVPTIPIIPVPGSTTPSGLPAPLQIPNLPAVTPTTTGNTSGTIGNFTAAPSTGITGIAPTDLGAGGSTGTGLPIPTLPSGVGNSQPTIPPANNNPSSLPAAPNLHGLGSTPTPDVPPATFRVGQQDIAGGFTMSKPAERTSEPVRTDFDIDLHEPRTGETYATISKLHYGDAKYADALRSFNRNVELGRATVEVPPMYVLRKRFSQPIARPAAGEPSRDRGIDWGPSSR